MTTSTLKPAVSTGEAVIAANKAPIRAVPPPTAAAAGPAAAARRAQARSAVAHSCLLALSCLISYWLATTILAHAHSGTADDLLGGMWAAIATVFVLRHSYHQSIAAALSRISATLVSFALCLAYLAFLPFHAWALAVLIGLSALAATLIGRPEDAITAVITTTVVLVVAQLSPHDAWHQPILRLADTVIGVAVGIAAAWTGPTFMHWASNAKNRPGRGSAAALPLVLPSAATTLQAPRPCENHHAPKIPGLPNGLDATGMRKESDSPGDVEVPANRHRGRADPAQLAAPQHRAPAGCPSRLPRGVRAARRGQGPGSHSRRENAPRPWFRGRQVQA